MTTATIQSVQQRKPAGSAGPDWYRDAIFYEISVKGFFDSNHDGIGDFAGLTQKLAYLQDLGVTALWLMPFYPSPLRDDGYDIADFRGIHPQYGSMADFQFFLKEAHQRGLRVVADMVVNHTSDQHPWFEAARRSPPGSPLRDFYVWRSEPIRQQSDVPKRTRSPRSTWTWDSEAGGFYWHHFADYEPDLNYYNPAVVAEMGKVLRFWLDLGIDGLSLSGVGQLVDRPVDGRTELPATHAVLRALRREVSGYGNRLLVAGVNAWPSDASSFCGQGDEAQMVPHLPLAQRMFMALEQEDRHPLDDILRQAPDLPEHSQWLTLLRNHDELTLELATDEERDYMFQQYAADLHMRHREGILRRLTPLLNNSRAKLELMLGLLFSLPGSPMIYYGDEIGMGDNVYLGDRNAIRTPMQWSADRNAGFSRCDFARLYQPPVQGPIYGYETVNVDAQRRDPSSMFHWLRRLIGLRKRLPMLGRGSLGILESTNRRIVALLRRYGDQTLLIVANLARSLQPVQLDLSEYAEMTPVEVFGRSVLPRIGREDYFLTLAPHSLNWFLLQKNPEEVAARLAPIPVEPLRELPSIGLSEQPETLFAEPALSTLERSVLPAYLKSQRWFGGKARQVQRVQVSQWQRIAAEPNPAFIALLNVTFAGGQRDLYLMPLAITLGKSLAELSEPMRRFAVAEFTGPRGHGLIIDALADDDACYALLNVVIEGQTVKLQSGEIRGVPTSDCQKLLGHNAQRLPLTRAGATSSNSLLLFGRRLLLKLFRRLEPGINPDVEIGRYFTEQRNFKSTPQLAGTLELTGAGDSLLTLAIVQALVPNQGDGWEHVIAELGRYYERATGRLRGNDSLPLDERSMLELAASDPPPVALEAIGGYLHAAATLGRRTAEMHLALAAGDSDSAFSPEPVDSSDLEELIDDIIYQGEQAISATRANVARLSGEIASSAQQILEQAPLMLERLRGERPTIHRAAKIRCHGDYHLGQVLWTDNDYVILDFEGEPTRSVIERRAKQSPLKDVAGMLRSYSYAAYAGLFNYAQDHPQDLAPLERWAELWRQWVSAAFLRSYLADVRNSNLLPHDPNELAKLLDLFLLDKAFYELTYELNNRPDWVRIPLAGVLEQMHDLTPEASP